MKIRFLYSSVVVVYWFCSCHPTEPVCYLALFLLGFFILLNLQVVELMADAAGEVNVVIRK